MGQQALTQPESEDAEQPEPPSQETSVDLSEAVRVRANIERESELYLENCSACHGQHAQGLIGPNLTDNYWLHGGDVDSIYQTIEQGVPEKACPAWGQGLLSREQIVGLVAFIDSIRGLAGATPCKACARPMRCAAGATHPW